MRTFVLEYASLCTVLWSLDHSEIRVKVGNETLTPRDLEAINSAIVDLLRERAQQPLGGKPPSARR